MQTFLPYPEFDRSAAVLDPARMGKQRVEVLQILRALTIRGYGWASHPAVAMWTGHVEALVAYGDAVSREWSNRGHADTCRPQIREFAPAARPQDELARLGLLPPWLGWEALHRSHQSALVRKDPAFYRAAFPHVPDDLPYVWPDPPAPAPRVELPRSAWIVRAPTPALLGSFVANGAVSLEPLAGARPREHLTLDAPPRRARKRHAVIERFVERMRPGEAVATPAGDRVLVGALTGGYEWAPLPPGRARWHLRTVRWERLVARSALRDPAALQDPQLVFEVFGEDLLADPVASDRAGAGA